MKASVAQYCNLTRLPSELLHQIFVLLSPLDIYQIAQTCQELHDYIDTANHLWKQIYLQRWDSPYSTSVDPLLTQPCPRTKTSMLSTKSLSKCTTIHAAENGTSDVKDEKRLYLDLTFYPHRGIFDHKTQVQRRAWAELQLRNAKERPFDLISNYNDLLRTLLSIVRSRQSRIDSETSASCQYLFDLLTSNSGYDNFKKLIYPRTDITRLREWQRKNLDERHSKRGKNEMIRKADGDKRNRSASVSSTLRDAKRRKTIAKEVAPSRSRRRSARLLLHNYPAELHHLLFDKDGNELFDLDDGHGIRSLEELELVDEQLAAELHVLHGIRPSKASSKQMNMTNAGSELFEHSEEEYDDEEDETELSNNDENAEDEDNDDDEDDDQLHHHHLNHHFHPHHHHHHLPLEQPLGSENGYEGDTILRGKAREIVYDTANYGPENSYGPLRAWRERWEVIDGIRPEDRIRHRQEEDVAAMDVNEEEEEEEATNGNGHLDNVPVIDLTNEDEEDEGDVAQLYEALQDVGWDPEWDPDAEFEADGDEDDEENDDEEEENDMLMMEVREQDIALSHGLWPFHESRRMKRAMIDYNVKTGQQKSWSISSSTTHLSSSDDDDDAIPSRPLKTVWSMEKRIDWVIVEAVMVVMSCNLRHAIANHGWGRAFRLPGTNRSLTGQDVEARRLYASQAPDIFPSAWRNLLCLPCGWNHSRGDERQWQGKKQEASEEIKEVDRLKEKPLDWASVESTWIGTYSFLDWSKWADYNAKSPASRGVSELSNISDPCQPLPPRITGTMSSLKHEREAVGDCLQLRMELLPLAEQKATSSRNEALEELEGPQSAKYPPLRFRGSTVTYLEDGPPTLRGQVHGVVSPVFATQDEDYYNTSDGNDDDDRERAIVGLHWQLNHAYDGEDRWSLSGIQPGPPGSRAPIYGIWGASDRTDNLSPCGPFTYMKVSDMPWKEVDQLLQDRR